MAIRLTHVGRLIADCWSVAEQKTISAVAKKHHGAGEELVTGVFLGELREVIEQASDADRFEHAFVDDLAMSLPNFGMGQAHSVRGLVARVNAHPRPHEGKRSGADLGLVITRPNVYVLGDMARIEESRRGLLVQAKLGRHRERGHAWRILKPRQQHVLEEHNSIYWLLLYRMLDPLGRDLGAFQWQSCLGYARSDVQGWLKSDSFPQLVSSADVLRELTTGHLGTTASSIIDSLVDPTSSRRNAIEIKVFWPGGPPPLGIALEQRQKVTVSLFRS